MWVDRHPSGEPRGLYAVRQRAEQEEIAADHPDVVGFISGGLVWDAGAWRAKTPAEIAAERSTEDTRDVDGLTAKDKLLLWILLGFEDRLRALEGKPAITDPQKIAALKTKLRQIKDTM